MKPVARDGKRAAYTGAEISGKRRENNSEAPAGERNEQAGERPGGLQSQLSSPALLWGTKHMNV